MNISLVFELSFEVDKMRVKMKLGGTNIFKSDVDGGGNRHFNLVSKKMRHFYLVSVTFSYNRKNRNFCNLYKLK